MDRRAARDRKYSVDGHVANHGELELGAFLGALVVKRLRGADLQNASLGHRHGAGGSGIGRRRSVLGALRVSRRRVARLLSIARLSIPWRRGLLPVALIGRIALLLGWITLLRGVLRRIALLLRRIVLPILGRIAVLRWIVLLRGVVLLGLGLIVGGVLRWRFVIGCRRCAVVLRVGVGGG